ncbi:DUF4153 domain-containing protein [Bacillus sp. EB600]|uniref:DUF4153 domain-containing protein n=1 Tax=Bacillus sp. EB600 TaxID=2806345 RepID=UPI00210C16A2|nr:DUF4153 domain-containing protein [Bacillus sp. EB600]MCQ6280295.1 DUF4153 domain-containing protein [Bacillus sp. EB600]
MKWMTKLTDRLTGLTDAIARFPLTTLFLLAAAMINAYDISTEKSVSKLLLTFVIGAFLSAVFQVAYERHFSKVSTRFVLMGVVVLLTAGYYLIIMPAPELSMEIEIRTAVALFTLLIAFIWVPVIKSKISFNKSFMITFKSFFNSLFFSAIIFGGISIILAAISQLIFPVDYKAYPHTSNIVFVIFAPMYFLSLIPVYLGEKDKNKTQETSNHQTETIDKAAHCPKFLEILISYIVIPLLAVFTLILAIYILKNIGGKFWTDNLLEPMLVSYAIAVILVYILASEIENKFALFFRRIIPKVLVPIVLFQITSSILSLADTGVTHTRYYVILFGIFAAIAGILLSFLPVRKNGVIAALLIIFSVISIVPPVDAFTISRTSQTNTLKNVLLKNNMLVNNKIKPNVSISNKDKQTITSAVQYLTMMEYTKKINWLPKNYVYDDFYQTFGFKEYYQEQENPNPSVYLSLEQPAPITISGYDTFVQTDIFMGQKNSGGKVTFEKAGKRFTLLREFKNDHTEISLIGENDHRLLSFNTKKIFDRFTNSTSTAKGQMSVKEATFKVESDRAKMAIVVQNVGIEKQNEQNNNALLYVFIKIK